MRGVAVICMIVMHTADGWLAASSKSGIGWDVIRLFGGMAAPLFLLLVGISLGAGWTAPGAHARARLRLGIARGLQIVVLGYVLRVQMWMLDGAGYRSATAMLVAACLLAGYAAAFVALGRWSKHGPAAALGAAAVLLGALGASAVSIWIPERVAGIFRVDVLQTIGLSIVLVSLVAARLRLGEAGAVLWPMPLVALGVGLATPLMRAWVPGPLPGPLAAYVAHWRPGEGALPAGFFPLFPWLAYPLVGAAVGVIWARQARAGSPHRTALWFAGGGAVLALVTCEALPPIFALLEASPWLTQAFRAGYRIGLGLVTAGLCVGLGRLGWLRAPLSWLGRCSLIVYWVHLEFVFGPLARPLARRLDGPAWTAWAFGLVCLMTVLAAAVAWMRTRRPQAYFSRVLAPETSAAKPL